MTELKWDPKKKGESLKILENGSKVQQTSNKTFNNIVGMTGYEKGTGIHSWILEFESTSKLSWDVYVVCSLLIIGFLTFVVHDRELLLTNIKLFTQHGDRVRLVELMYLVKIVSSQWVECFELTQSGRSIKTKILEFSQRKLLRFRVRFKLSLESQNGFNLERKIKSN